jgi:hypothetical protein
VINHRLERSTERRVLNIADHTDNSERPTPGKIPSERTNRPGGRVDATPDGIDSRKCSMREGFVHKDDRFTRNPVVAGKEPA